MPKMITRTVTTYKYYVGKFNPRTNTMENIDVFSANVKLGQRAQAAKAKEYGGVVYYVEEAEELRGMSIEDFVRYSKPVTKDEAEE